MFHVPIFGWGAIGTASDVDVRAVLVVVPSHPVHPVDPVAEALMRVLLPAGAGPARDVLPAPAPAPRPRVLPVDPLRRPGLSLPATHRVHPLIGGYVLGHCVL